VTTAAHVVLALGIATAWLGALAFVRLKTPLERLHVVTFVNVVTGGAVMVAAFLTEGVTGRTLKCALIWVVTLLVGALLSQVSGRALNLRGGERR
jgi:multicomponent Na+:H+ antiporter subunit G